MFTRGGILLFDLKGVYTNSEYRWKIEPVWKTLDAVQNDQIFEIDGWSFWFSDPISILGQIEEVTEMIAQQVKGK